MHRYLLYFNPVCYNIIVHTCLVCTCRVQCEFYMRDREGMSISAEKILEVIRTQTVVYFNSTEYRVLQVERANNQTSSVDPIPSSGKDTIVL